MTIIHFSYLMLELYCKFLSTQISHKSFLMESTVIYKYFTLVPNQEKTDTVIFYCNICKDNGRLGKDGKNITCIIYRNSTSNLFTHLRKDLPNHAEALKAVEDSSNTPGSTKKRRLSLFTSNSPLQKSELSK